MRTICGTILASAVAVGVVRADVPKTVNGKVDLAKAEEVHVREGAGNFLAKMVPRDEAMLVGKGWTKLAENEPEQKSFEKRGGQFWRADRPRAKLAFRFRGTKCGVYDLLAPKGANVRITVDGKVTRESCTANALKADSSPLGPLNRF